MQKFKENDEIEIRVAGATLPVLADIGDELDAFYEGAWQAAPLGDALFDTGRDPIIGVVTKDTFRNSFYAIHDLFTRPGTFEFYLDVFRAIFGPDVIVQFDVPTPGVLNIEIEAVDSIESIFLAREIVSSAYIYEEVIDHDGDELAFQIDQGVLLQSEINALMREITPNGIFATATLV